MRNLLLLMSGSIACEKASGLIALWHQRGGIVRVILTPAATEFVDKARLLELGAEAVYLDTFARGEQMQHIDLGHWADLIVLAPATANTLNKMAAGIADDMVTTTLLAAYGLGKPSLIVPAMNSRMLAFPATANSLTTLQSWGYQILDTAVGELACGELGPGRMLEVEAILTALDALAGGGQVSHAEPKGQLLITVGGTREAIDSVRYIGNGSSGRTASMLADQFVLAGYQVTALCAESALKPRFADIISFVSFADLAQQLKYQLSTHEFSAVIHPAAVSDYSVEALLDDKGRALTGQAGKISSEAGLQIRLRPNPKLLGQLRGWSKDPQIKVVGFKLTDTTEKNLQRLAVNKLLQQDSIDAVVHNDLSEITADQHQFHLYSYKGVQSWQGARALATALQRWMEEQK